jgi:hypothetical protein
MIATLGYNGGIRRQDKESSHHGQDGLALFRSLRYWCVGGQHPSQRPFGDKSPAGTLLQLQNADVCPAAPFLRVAGDVWGMGMSPLRDQDG